jgi:NAD-dependent SIR2 family protein deacetylase
MLDEADVLLVVGSSLAVYSGFRFVRGAEERGVPIAIVNIGPTRGDAHARVRVHGTAGAVLGAVRDALAPGVLANRASLD